jgi:hypothetical protein
LNSKEKNDTSCYRLSAIPTHGFTVVVSVFGGTPSTKPLKCKFKVCLGHSGSDPDLAWAHHTGDDSKLVFAKICFVPSDITWMSLCCRSLFRSVFSFVGGHQDKQKTLLTFGKQGLENSNSLVTCLPFYPRLRVSGPNTPWTG